MATASFTDASGRQIGSVTQLDYPISTITQTNYPVSVFNGILPFRVNFTSVTIPGYTAEYNAPIGIAVIGQSFYIL